ncbi:Cell division control protein [Gracilaria domingensis]|nr:Cell division control protein [Gracilaria domingensis]
MHSDDKKALDEAQRLEEKVLRNNDIDATINLADLLLYHRSFASQRWRGIQLLERAVKQAHHPGAMYQLAVYILNNGRKQEHFRAFSLLERSFRLYEHPSPLRELGYCYSYGRGTAKDSETAIQLFERALRLKQDPSIMFALGESMLKAPSHKAQKKRALALCRKAIQLSSDAQMMNDMGLMYYFGAANLTESRTRASKWFSRAICEAELPASMSNFAILLLLDDPSVEDVQLAVRLLEHTLEKVQHENTMLQLAAAYCQHDIDSERALELYESAALQFDSEEARLKLHDAWLHGMNGMRPGHTRIFKFCLLDVKKNQNWLSCMAFLGLKWTGANHIRMNRKKVMDYLCSNHLINHGLFQLMLRHDASYWPSGETEARELTKKFKENIDRSNISKTEAILLSESENEIDKSLALERIRGETHNAQPHAVWLSLFHRKSRFRIPFDGHLDSVTSPVRTFALWRTVASLNLASLLLEIEDGEQEAVSVLESLMDSQLRLIAMMNLAHVLMNDFRGVKKNRARGLQLLEDAVKETNDVSARAMLANALSEREPSDGGDLERGWKLWQSIENDEEDEEELRNIGRLVSGSIKKRWDELAFRSKVRIGDSSLDV